MTIAADVGQHRANSPCRRHETEITTGQPTDLDPALWALFRRLSPRSALRVDLGRVHEYRSAPFTALPPVDPVPYAVYLADRAGRYRLLCFDLDDSAGPDVVAEDLARLCELLDEAGVRYAVAASGSRAGRHVWAAFPAGVAADRVAELARALVAVLPSLDAGMLHNPMMGCARPPGSPHRRGGVSRFDPAWHPEPASAVEALTAGNPPEAFDRLLSVLPPAVRQSAARPVKPSRRRAVVNDAEGPRLVGTRRALSPKVAALVASEPEGGDYSAHLWRILIGAALAHWTLEQVAELITGTDAVGLEHLRSRAHDGRRTARTAEQTREILARQWGRAVERAAGLPTRAVPDDADQVDPRVVEVTEAVAAVHAAAEAMPWRWATQAGPADRAALRAACRMALACCSLTFALDVRRWSALTGYAASTMSAASRRLCSAHPIDGPAWLTEDTPAVGRNAAVWNLTSPVPVCPVDKGRTQGRSPRPPARPSLQHLLTTLGAHTAHDVWHPRGGLGHHTERTHAALLAGARTTDQLTSATGYSAPTIRRHLDRLTTHGLAITSHGGRRARPGRRSLDTVAARLGTAGVGEARRTRHVVDRELRAWWDAEQEWRRTPKTDKPRIPRWPAVPGQRALPVVAAGPLATYGRFPTRKGGRADYTTATATVRTRINATIPARRPAA